MGKELREGFIDFLLSREYKQLLSVVPISLLRTNDIDWPEPASPLLSHSMVTKYTYTSGVTLENMTSHEKDVFIDEILETKSRTTQLKLG